MKDTAIEWADNTINFFVGCTKVSEGCKNCYMYRLETRFGRDPKLIRKTKWDTIEKNLKKWDASRLTPNLNFFSSTKELSCTQTRNIGTYI